jgi:hypothetical protein
MLWIKNLKSVCKTQQFWNDDDVKRDHSGKLIFLPGGEC